MAGRITRSQTKKVEAFQAQSAQAYNPKQNYYLQSFAKYIGKKVEVVVQEENSIKTFQGILVYESPFIIELELLQSKSSVVVRKQFILQINQLSKRNSCPALSV